MKVLFAHDHIFLKYNNLMYSSGGLSKEMIERYTRIFESVNIISRQKELDEFDSQLTLASTEKANFIKIPDFKSVRNSYKSIKAKKTIYKEVRAAEAVIARLPSSIGFMALKAAKKYNKPYLVEVVACPWDAYWNHSLKGKIVAPFSYLRMKTSVANSPYTIYVTNEFLQKRYPTRGKNTNCSNVALTEFDYKVLEDRKNKIENPIESNKFIIGTTAAVNVKYKGQDAIIKALSKLKKEGHTHVEYQLVGKGDQSYLKELAKEYNVQDQVRFLGSLPHKDVFSWLETIDLYSQPSKQEGLPRALIEAMSRALPAFGAKTAGIPELISSKFIFNHGKNNIDEIVSIIKSFDQATMLEQAEINYNESKKYDKRLIEKRRTDFLKSFKSSVVK